MSTAFTQLYSIFIKKFQWAPFLGRHAAHQAQQRTGENEGFRYLIQLNREEPSPDKWGGALCVVQGLKEICKHNYIGDRKGFVGCSWFLESVTVVIGWWLSILIVTWHRKINLNLEKKCPIITC
jgi:hypothetical protein